MPEPVGNNSHVKKDLDRTLKDMAGLAVSK